MGWSTVTTRIRFPAGASPRRHFNRKAIRRMSTQHFQSERPEVSFPVGFLVMTPLSLYVSTAVFSTAGSGQYGVVYEALFKPYDVTVAVKTLKVR